MEPAPLPGHVLEQRIKAACWLNGIGMRQLRNRLGAIKAPKLLAEEMIKGEKPQDRRNRRDLAEALKVPEDWIVNADWQLLVVGASELDEAQELARLADEEREALEKDVAAHSQRYAPSARHSAKPKRGAQT